LGLTLGGVGYGRYWWITGRFIESTDDAYVGGNITPVSPHVAGFVAQLVVDDNQYVRAGQLLIRLDPRDFAAALDHARAVLAGRQAALAGLEAKYLWQQQMIEEAEADLDARLAQASFAQQDAVRYHDLALASFGSRQAAERTAAADRAARSATQSARAGLTAARQQLRVLDAETAEARAGVAQAEADLETARLDLGYTEIRSPIDGYVGNRSAQVGAYVARDAYLLSVIPAHGLWVDANFKEDQLARMRSGQPATVVADVLPDKIFHGHVASLAPGTGAVFSVIPPENATGNFTKIVQRVPVRIVLDAARLGELRPGLSTTVSVDTDPGPRSGE
jgi:membrane fusion protein, multidrug efflux system